MEDWRMHFQLGKSLSTFCIPAVPTQELKIKREDEKLFEEAFLDTQILVSVANQKPFAKYNLQGLRSLTQ